MNEPRPRQRHGTASPDGERALRLFVSVELSEAWRRAADRVAHELQATLRQEYRWVRPELYHVTVVFLGEQPPERLGTIEDALRAATEGVPPFELRLGGLSGLGVDVPRALILAVADPFGGLRALRRRLDHELTERRIPFDRKPLSPHLTLGRARVQRGRGGIDRPGRASTAPIPKIPQPDVGPLNVTKSALVKSDLLPGGPRYEVIWRAPLQRP